MGWPPYSPVRRGIHFGRAEIRHILLAIVVLTAAFAIAFAGGVGANPTDLLGFFVVAVVAVPTGFLLHELGHKVVAQRYGLLAEFRSWSFGLLLALLTAVLAAVIFAAPGAVVISGVVNRQQNGRISAAGPFTNLVIGSFFLLLWYLLFQLGINFPIAGQVTLLLFLVLVAFINLLLGAFNMIPIPPLDGSKVIRWDLPTYFLLTIPLVALTAFLVFGRVLF